MKSRIAPIEVRTAASSAHIMKKVPAATPTATAGKRRSSVGQWA